MTNKKISKFSHQFTKHNLNSGGRILIRLKKHHKIVCITIMICTSLAQYSWLFVGIWRYWCKVFFILSQIPL